MINKYSFFNATNNNFIYIFTGFPHQGDRFLEFKMRFLKYLQHSVRTCTPKGQKEGEHKIISPHLKYEICASQTFNELHPIASCGILPPIENMFLALINEAQIFLCKIREIKSGVLKICPT